ncbi:MAG: NusG domain II-containing protein [Candidatus Izemoplasmatales bacterium]
MKRNDLIFIGATLLLGLLSLLGFTLYDRLSVAGGAFAQVYYRDELILMIDLDTGSYTVFPTEYEDFVNVDYADEGTFYVPGTTTEAFADDRMIPGVKLRVADGKISVAFQESPKDICEYQPPTDSALSPLVCLPNELVVTVRTDMDPDAFVPDVVME